MAKIHGTLQRDNTYLVTLCDRYYMLQKDYDDLEKYCIVQAR